MQKYRQVVFVSTMNDASPLVKRDILNQFNEDAIRYFQRGEITGLLFYGNDHFFHFFECDAKQLNQLKADVLAYPHHHGQKLIHEQAVPQRKFNSWQMKYTQNDALVQAFFVRHGWQQFEPYLLQGELLDEFMAIVLTYADNSEVFAEQLAGNTQIKQAGLMHYLLGTLALIALAWLILMLLDYFGYIDLKFLHYQQL